jgi:putative ABC transport system permease protein
VDNMWPDVRHAARSLRASPLFALVSVLSLAIGISGTAIVFNIADAYLFQPRSGMRDVSRLVEVGRTDSTVGSGRYGGGDFDSFSYPNYLDYRERQTSFEGLAAIRVNATFGLGAEGSSPVRVTGAFVSADYFSVLGVVMQLGRPFRPDEDAASSPVTVAVLSDRLWRTSFGGDPSIVGRTIRVNGRPFTVIGVTTPSFSGHSLEVANMWIPLTAYPDGDDLRRFGRRDQQWLFGVGRLKDGVTAAQAQAELTRIARDLERDYPEDNARHGLGVAVLGPVPPGGRLIITRFVSMLFALVSVVLILACTNVGGMMLARGVNRTREIALRLALGAARRRVIRQLTIESLLVATLATIVGIGLTWLGIRALERAIPILRLDVVFGLGITWRVIGCAALAASLATIAAGLLPAVQTSGVDLATAIGRENRTPRHLRTRQLLVVAQIAMAVVLAVCGVLLSRSLGNAMAIDPGFQRAGVDVVGLNLQLGGYDPKTGPAFAQDLLARVEALPSVASAAFARVVPLTGEAEGGRVWRVDDRADDRAISVNRNFVSPDYFRTIGLPLVAGRAFAASDRAGAPLVAIVNETFARRVWPGQNPVGQRLLAYASRRTLEVVGLARDAKYRTIGEGPQPFVYVPAAQAYDHVMWLLIRPRDSGAIADIRSLVTSVNPNLPLDRTATLMDMEAFTLFPQRLASWITGAIAVLGLFLAALGLYGLIAFDVGQRTREIGIRMALGALRSQVVAAVVAGAGLLAGVGTAIGLAAAALITGLLTGILYGVQPLDPVAFGGAAALLAVIAVVASVAPARRAASVNPADALRAE